MCCYIASPPQCMFFIPSADFCFHQRGRLAQHKTHVRTSQARKLHRPGLCPALYPLRYFVWALQRGSRNWSQVFWASLAMPFWELVPLGRWIVKAFCEGCRQFDHGRQITDFLIGLLNMQCSLLVDSF